MLAFMQPVQGDLAPFVRKDVNTQDSFSNITMKKSDLPASSKKKRKRLLFTMTTRGEKPPNKDVIIPE